MTSSYESQMPTLVFLVLGSVSIGWTLRAKPPAQRSFRLALGVITALFAVKFACEIQENPDNFYRTLSVPRHGTSVSIRQAYKRVSLKLHPDKSTRAGASAEFQRVNDIYEILSDEKLRDVYNRFGENVSTDPRLDDFSLIMSLFTDALYWALIAYVITIPRGSQGCRTWMILSLMGVSAGSFAFQLSGVDIPNFEFMGLNFLSCVTEHDVLITSHRLVPFILMLLVAVSEYYYINTEILAAEVLENFIISQKEMLGVINDLQLELSVSLDHGNTSFDRVAVDKKLAEFKLRVVNCNGTISETANILKKKSGSVGETFHWLVFIFIFASAYVFSSDQ